MPYYERDQAGALVPTKGDVPEEAILAIERADEQTIVETLTRVDAQPTFAYSWTIKTKEGLKEVIGIGTDGAKQIARELGNIKASPDIKVDEKNDRLYALVPVTDLIRNVTLLGAASQSIYVLGEGWEPTERRDEHAWVKVISKAQRNGILAVADQLMIAQIISRLDVKAIKKLPAPPGYGKALPKAKTPAPAAAGKAEPPKEPTAEELGYSSEAEQSQMRKELFNNLLPALGRNTDEEKRAYLKERNIGNTKKLPKEELQKVIDEVTKEVSALKEAEGLSEDL